MKDGYRVVDADAHVIEPDDLWARYFDASLRDRAPRHLNRAFAIQVDGIPINTPADWETETSAEQTAHRDERISATFRLFALVPNQTTISASGANGSIVRACGRPFESRVISAQWRAVFMISRAVASKL